MNPLVSILVPAYNAERWIASTIESALAQTWANKEVIVVDDGSTDGTLAVARRYESTQVRVLTQPNQGAAAARNTALVHCQGDYIQWLDADDLLAPDKVALQMRSADDCGSPYVLLSGPWAYFMYRPERARFESTALWQDLAPTEWLIRKWFGNLHMQPATWLVSRELTDAAGPWDTSLLVDDDGEYFTRTVLASTGVRFVPEARVFYRVVGTNRVSHIGISESKRESQFASMQLQIARLRSIDDGPRTRAAVVAYLQTWVPLFYPERLDLVAEMQALANAAGGEITMPRATPKYAWIEALFGAAAAKKAQLRYNAAKTSVLRSWDRMLHVIESK
jgi:glycosyltransferase involved in cell wall biosynthesis